ncbi:hypothetical protein Tco_1254987 [Tanacetum coccineum]
MGSLAVVLPCADSNFMTSRSKFLKAKALIPLVSSVDVVDIDEFCLHDLKEMILKLELATYAKNNKIILLYVEHGSTNVDSSIFVTPKKGVTIAVDNHLRKAPIKIDSSPDMNRNLTPMCKRNLTKEWEEVSSNKALSIDEVLKKLSNKQPVCSDKGPIVVETDDHFYDLEERLGDYANTKKEIIVHVGNSSIVKNVVDYGILYKTEGVGPMGNFKEVEVDVDNETEEESEESDKKENDTSGSDSEDLDYDPKHDEVFMMMSIYLKMFPKV